MKVRSIVGILPLLAVAVVDEHAIERAESVHKRGEALVASRRAEIEELNIGHSVVSRAVMVGMRTAVEDMARLVKGARP